MTITTRTQLVDLMKIHNLPLIIAEVGVAGGAFASDLLKHGAEKLYLIDVWEHIPFIKGMASDEQKVHDANYNQMLERIEPWKEKVTILKGFSYKMAEHIPDNSLGAVYIDGDHTEEGVATDLEFFYPKLVHGGIMSGHDYINKSYGVYEAVAKFARGKQINIITEGGVESNMGFWFTKE